MQFSYHQVITFLGIVSGFALLFSGTAGVDVLLYLCGVTILAAVVIPNRKIDLALQLKSFKLRLRSHSDTESTAQPRLDRSVSTEDASGAPQADDKPR